VKKLRVSWKLVALFVLGAIGSGLYVTRLKAFTLIEVQYLPAVQLIASQEVAVNVSNFSAEPVTVNIQIFSGGGGLLGEVQSEVIEPGKTYSLSYVQSGGTVAARAVVAAGTASSVVSSLVAFDKATRQVIAIAPALIIGS